MKNAQTFRSFSPFMMSFFLLFFSSAFSLFLIFSNLIVMSWKVSLTKFFKCSTHLPLYYLLLMFFSCFLNINLVFFTYVKYLRTETRISSLSTTAHSRWKACPLKWFNRRYHGQHDTITACSVSGCILPRKAGRICF